MYRGFLRLENSPDTIFFAKPPKILINENDWIWYQTSKKIGDLMLDLRERGPLVGQGKLGPSTYVLQAQFLHELHGRKIYGWKPVTERSTKLFSSSIIVLGARIVGDKAYVYFTTSLDITINKDDAHRTHIPSCGTIYAISHAIFRNDIQHLFPAVIEPIEEKTSS